MKARVTTADFEGVFNLLMVCCANMKVYGNGTQDDWPGIQEQLDSLVSCVYLPPPEKCYLISKPLILHSGQELRLDKATVIKLAPGSDCVMLANDNPGGGNEHITVTGGIWDMQNVLQSPNPYIARPDIVGWGIKKTYSPDIYTGVLMRFVNVKHFALSGIVFLDPVTYCAQLAKMEYFFVKDITFDFRQWNPIPHNMDGIHLDGECRFGTICNLKGRTFDDLVALNADDDDLSPCLGPIEDIKIDGIFARDCHSAVRLLSKGSVVRNISISNIFGTYYQYCIGFTKFMYRESREGMFRNIAINGLYASKARRYSYLKKDDSEDFPLIWMERETKISSLSITDMVRDEEEVSLPSIGISEGATVETLSLRNVRLENLTGGETCILHNAGKIGRLEFSNVQTGQRILINHGVIESCIGAHED